MLGVGDKLPDFSVTGVKPKFNNHEENGHSAFETITQESFPGLWKIIYFYPKDFTFLCSTEIVQYGELASEFLQKGAVVLGGSSDNEFCKLAWRRDTPELNNHPAWQFADTTGSLIDGIGIRSAQGVALRATYITDPHNMIQHVSVNNISVGRNPQEILRIFDGLLTDKPCPCNIPINSDTL